MSLNFNFKPVFVDNSLLSSKRNSIIYSKCIRCMEDIASINKYSISDLCYVCKNKSHKSLNINKHTKNVHSTRL